MKPTEKIEQLLNNMNVTPAPDRDRQMLNAVLQAQAETNNQSPASIKPGRWSTIMRKPITKFAAAAIVFFAVILGINLIPGTNQIALGNVIDTFKNAVCISYDLRVGEDSPIIHDTVYGNRIRRETMGNTVMIDLEQRKIMTLVPQTKQAVIIGFDGLPEMPKNYVDHLVNLLSKVQESEDIKLESLDPQTVDGRTLEGHFFKHENVEVEIWIDTESELPAVIVEKRPGLEITMSNFDFDVEYDPELFSMDPPEGYTLVDGQDMIDFAKDVNEENFIALLKMLAETNDGWFLQDISVPYIMKNAMEIGHRIEKTYDSMMEQMAAGVMMGKGITFIRFYQGQGQWHYAGNGVKLGQAEEPIFWYQPKESDLFRVIFGDLHVEEVHPDDLDALVSEREAASKAAYQLWDKEEFVTHQEDEWHVKAADTIEVHSKIDIKKGPEELSRIQLSLPFENAEIISAMLGEADLPFEQDNPVQYSFYPDSKTLLAGAHVINLVWKFPLGNLNTIDSGYQVPLQSLLPATLYKITAILDEDCAYTWNMTQEELEEAMKFLPSPEPDNPRMITLFTQSGPDAKTTFGFCGLSIKPK